MVTLIRADPRSHLRKSAFQNRMKYITEYRDSKITQGLARQITRSSQGRELTFMEVCGTHTMALAKFGIKDLLPENVSLLSGPGCPVCVTPNDYIDRAIALSRCNDVIVTTFGDMMRVPGSTSSLEKERASGCNIQMVYSPLDALKIAKKYYDKKVVFLSVGFETTIPGIAATIIEALRCHSEKSTVSGRRRIQSEQSGSFANAQDDIHKDTNNFFILTANKVVIPALEALVQGDLKLNGFILPGHVSTIIGAKAYENIANKYRVPCSIAGFEPVDMLSAILDLTTQAVAGKPEVSIKYRRAVTFEGNVKARSLIYEVFEPCDAIWRGIGTIPGSGLELKGAYRNYDARSQLPVVVEQTIEPKGCMCGAVLQGLKNPPDCPLFGKSCTPEDPVGACMVSSEGTCAAWFKYADSR